MLILGDTMSPYMIDLVAICHAICVVLARLYYDGRSTALRPLYYDGTMFWVHYTLFDLI